MYLHTEYAVKACRGAIILLLFVNLGKNAYGRGLLLGYVASV
jgi:hypothetical protein